MDAFLSHTRLVSSIQKLISSFISQLIEDLGQLFAAEELRSAWPQTGNKTTWDNSITLPIAESLAKTEMIRTGLRGFSPAPRLQEHATARASPTS